ncbi:unnamed protein product [Prorocentrum cordatum]|uniref:Uncharacterized protein n=1 Tax=Prorocentrum cordatum TaxID=2364126 RepID=A0ABN9WYF4_9DINO|nr:unnamed protein product [Polarella glacialis]
MNSVLRSHLLRQVRLPSTRSSSLEKQRINSARGPPAGEPSSSSELGLLLLKRPARVCLARRLRPPALFERCSGVRQGTAMRLRCGATARRRECNATGEVNGAAATAPAHRSRSFSGVSLWTLKHVLCK